MKKLEIDGETWKVNGDPSMRVVKYVQQMEISLMEDYIGQEALMEMEASDDPNMSEIVKDLTMEDLKGMMWERSTTLLLQTICLGTNRIIDIDEFEDMSSQDVMNLKQASEDELGGDAEDFLAKLGIDISSKMNEIQEETQTQSHNTPPTMQNSVLGASSEQ